MPETSIPRRLDPAASPLHSGIRVPTVVVLQIIATLFPLLAGFALFGWRAGGSAAAVVLDALAPPPSSARSVGAVANSAPGIASR